MVTLVVPKAKARSSMSTMSNGPYQESPEERRAAKECILKFKDAFFWLYNQPEVCERYADQVVIVHERQVVGHGASEEEALEAAKRFFTGLGQPMPPPGHLAIMVAPTSLWMDAPIPYANEPFSSPAGSPTEE
jgi:hypothetical protein